MSYTEHPFLVATVGEDHTLVLPNSIPSGATVGIVVLAERPSRPLSRKERFRAALAEIEAATIHSQQNPLLMPSDAEFDALIDRARKEARAA